MIASEHVEKADSQTYPVLCATCHAPFDALQAAWCSCLATERSLVCPSCFSCFCRAGAAYARSFWAGAPAVLRAAKHWENSPTLEPLAQATAVPGPRARPLVLLVEDESVIRRVAHRVISRLGYDLIVATNGEEGLEMARRYHPNLVLTDALMPKMDGRDMCRALKSDPATADIKIVVMTALYTSVKHQVAGFKGYRADGYVAKPLDHLQLRTLIGQLIGIPAPREQAIPLPESTAAYAMA